VVLLDHRVYDQVSTRRLRVVKYRGSYHGTNQYPVSTPDDGPPSASGVKTLPLPMRRLVGDMSDRDRVLVGHSISCANPIPRNKTMVISEPPAPEPGWPDRIRTSSK